MRKVIFPRSRPNSSEQYLYHYTKAEIALKCILPARTLRARSFVHMNDPRESKEWRFAPIARTGEDIDSYAMVEYNDALSKRAHDAGRLAQQIVKVLAFSTDDQACAPYANEESVNLRGFAHSAMWYHYAEKHTGVCLVLDKARFSAAVERWAMRPENLKVRDSVFHGLVQYKERWWPELPIGGTAYVLEDSGRSLQFETFTHIRRFWRELLLEKSTDWSYEREYRWLFLAEGPDHLDVFFDDALVGIVVGADFGRDQGTDKEVESAFRDLDLGCRSLNISLKQIFWSNGVAYLASRNWRRR